MDENQVKSKSNFSLVLRYILRLVEFVFLLFCWLMYAYLTLDRSEKALAYSSGNPMPAKYSFLILGLVLTFFFRKSLFVKKWSFGLILQRLLVVLVFIFGVMIYMTSQSL